MIRCRRRTKEERHLLKAILRLPTDLRDVFLLHRMAGLSYGQIGEQLGMEPHEVQDRVAEALAQISRAASPAEG